MPKLRIEETAARRQARIDRGEDVIVGVNKFQLAEEPEIDTREIDNTAVREAQVARLEADPRDARRRARSHAALDALTQLRRERRRATCSRSAVEAARARATVGEISDALEKVWGRYHAEIRSISGVYGGAVRRRRGLEGAAAPRSTRSPPSTAGGRACWSPRSARTATTAAPR